VRTKSATPRAMFAAVLFAGASVLGESGSGGNDGVVESPPPSSPPPASPSPPFEECVKDDNGQCEFLVNVSFTNYVGADCKGNLTVSSHHIVTIGYPFPSGGGVAPYLSCSNDKVIHYEHLSNLSQGLPTNECNQSAVGDQPPCVTTHTVGCQAVEPGKMSVKITFNDKVCPGGDIKLVNKYELTISVATDASKADFSAEHEDVLRAIFAKEAGVDESAVDITIVETSGKAEITAAIVLDTEADATAAEASFKEKLDTADLASDFLSSDDLPDFKATSGAVIEVETKPVAVGSERGGGNAAAIGGGVAGGVVALILIAILIMKAGGGGGGGGGGDSGLQLDDGGNNKI